MKVISATITVFLLMAGKSTTMSSLPHEKLLESPRSYQQPHAELVHQQPIGFQQPPAEPVYQQPIGYQMPSASVVSMPMIQVQAELKNAARGLIHKISEISPQDFANALVISVAVAMHGGVSLALPAAQPVVWEKTVAVVVGLGAASPQPVGLL
ncbi:hypothetical protein EB796_004456 [Bugula neritina]|uniref:Uncharacterized protein n=1 Tax=Bugula neritina TaxID=10212 RepID=A0A7J7KH76_BUGNE|nr:hypothetical protein EB796_004456 [Bugula neritina]